jgi:drug/metabolite transporter (DMT)-like permease
MFALYREVFASILMYGLVRYYGKFVFVHPEDYQRMLFLGFCSFVNVVGTILALQYINPVRYSVMQPIIPVIATLISVGIGLESLSPIKSCGILAAVGGAILVETWHASSDDESSNVVLGTILVCVQVTAMASLIVFQKPILSKYDPAVLTFVYYAIGSGYLLSSHLLDLLFSF